MIFTQEAPLTRKWFSGRSCIRSNWNKLGVNFEEGGNRSARRKPSMSDWDRLKFNPHTTFVVEVEGVIDVHYASLTSLFNREAPLYFIVELQVRTDDFSHNTTTFLSLFSRTWKDLWKFEAVSWSQRMKIFLQFLLGEYSFYKTKMKEQALRLVWYEWLSPPKRSSIRALLYLDFYSGWLESAKFFLAKLPSSASQPDAKNTERFLGLLQSFALNPGYTSFIQG